MTKYNPDAHHRRSIRLKDYDYRQPGLYFVTVCVHLQECCFGQVINAQIELNTLGCIVDACWNKIPVHFPHAQLDTYVIMPNHLHGIIEITDGRDAVGARHAVPLQNIASSELFGKPVSGSLATIVRSFKAASTREVNAIRGTVDEKLWQRNYFEKVILTEKDLDRIRYYILSNPERWLSELPN